MTHLVLVGMMATGKSSVGRLVAEALDRPLLDSDEQIEARTGRTVREIWRTDGEPAFRRLEAEVLAEALAAPTPMVIAAAGGIVLDPANRALLAAGDVDVVWLRARPETLLARLRAVDHVHRPLLDEDAEGTLVRMHTDREPLYEEVSARVIDVDERTPTEVAAAVVDRVER